MEDYRAALTFCSSCSCFCQPCLDVQKVEQTVHWIDQMNQVSIIMSIKIIIIIKQVSNDKELCKRDVLLQGIGPLQPHIMFLYTCI